MAAIYKQFLAAPSSSLLSDKATLHYVTTAISFNGPTDIIKHLNALQRQVIKKKENILNVVDGQNTIALEVETGLEFQTSGGSYCPGLDDNFLSNRLVELPIVHIVTFDADGKISQVRIQWDQGSVLKQLDVIGKTGRNWPIKDGREQISAIQSSLKAGGVSQAPENQREMLIRTRGNSTNAMRDPHASLHRQPTREEIEAEIAAPVVSPYGGNRPQQRSFADILGDEPLEAGSPTAHRQRTDSPSKAGQGKNFQPMRLFDGQEHVEEDDAPKGKAGNQFIRPNPKKYQHFDFADGSDPQDSPQRGTSFDERPKSKHDSQWSFNDFVTPAKPKGSKIVRTQDVRHWDTDRDAMGETPAQPVIKARRDAEAHFELQDDGERDPRQERPVTRPRGSTHNEGLGLYKNKLFDRDDASAPSQRPLGNITNLKDRGKDFEAHFAMTDDSPSQAQQPQQQHLPEGRMKAVKMMDSNWSVSDESPVSQKENKPQPSAGTAQGQSRIHIAGDGMGSRKGAANVEDNTRIHIAGDGMGGKKGTNRDWLYGGGGEDPAPEPTRKGNQAAAKKSFWDF